MDRLHIAQVDTGNQSVCLVLFGSIAWADRGGDATLCPSSRSSIEHGLRHHENFEITAPSLQGQTQTRDATTDDHHVSTRGPARCRCEKSASQGLARENTHEVTVVIDIVSQPSRWSYRSNALFPPWLQSTTVHHHGKREGPAQGCRDEPTRRTARAPQAH
ncbi:unannotated protein [freshwater metagenome]|uniref:Unannotated protein n=1 Tax=freshwater metagenome TaxID=449393 RepID=A0A6J6XRZ0_9ZZZZ